MRKQILVEKQSDTMVKITKPRPVEEDEEVRSKTDILNRIAFIEQSIADTQSIFNERIAALEDEKEDLEDILNQADAQGVKTDEEALVLEEQEEEISESKKD